MMTRNHLRGTKTKTTAGQLRLPRVKAEYFDEPSVGFGGGREHVDQKMGITLFEPQSLDRKRHPESMKLGFVGVWTK